LRKQDQKNFVSLPMFQIEAITAAIILCPNQHIEEPYSRFMSLYLL